LIRFGFEEAEHKQKMTFKHTALNNKVPDGVNHHKSMYVMCMQRSNYMCIDDNINKDFIFKNHEKKEMKDKLINELRQIYKT